MSSTYANGGNCPRVVRHRKCGRVVESLRDQPLAGGDDIKRRP
jgi:hypothetical protein